MDVIVSWFALHANHAHFIIFGLLLLAGFCLPISEEVMLIMSGFLASSIIPDHDVHLFLAAFLGCYFSDWIAYWLGRLVGARLYSVKWFQFALNARRVKRLGRFYERHGFLTLVVGRFIPFGVRNGIFMTAGIGRMHFGKFAAIDLGGCAIFSSLLFTLAYSFGKNYDHLVAIVQKGNVLIFALFIVTILSGVLVLWARRKPRTEPI
jgi:membrane protein DedA with SNARE-associated domain